MGSSNGAHPIEAIHALVDDRLPLDERQEVEAHLSTCETCRSELDMARATRRLVRGAVAPAEPPEGFADELRKTLGDAERETAISPARRRRSLAAAAIVVISLAAVTLMIRSYITGPDIDAPESIVAQVSADFTAVQEERLTLEAVDATPAELEKYFAARDVGFETRVFDLAMMGYRVSGGRVQSLTSRNSALFAYRGPDGELMLCRMYLGSLAELPPPDRVLHDRGIKFRVYEREGRTLVFWEEGEVVCVLASDAPTQQVIEFSFAKAIKT